MGWWHPRSNKDSVIGDVALDALGRAVSEVIDAYSAQLQRKPTAVEWQILLSLVIDNRSVENSSDSKPQITIHFGEVQD